MSFSNIVPIGLPGCPWPTMISTETRVNKKIVTRTELGVLQDASKPMLLPSKRSYAETMGHLYRSLPVRSQLAAFEFLIRRANPNQNNRVANLMGNPGVGKSRMAINLCKARDPRGPIVTDAGGKNLEYLLFQTVFDTEESRTLTEAIDKRLAEGSLDKLSLNRLKVFGKHFIEEDEGSYRIDWLALSEDQDLGVQDDGQGNKTQEKKPDELIRSVLEFVRTIERLDSKSMGIGFKVKEGPLVQAHREGRDIVIDEINKCKEGSETPLQIVWQVLNGETAEHTVSLGSNGSFTFRRGQPGLVICTGNLPKDGQATHLISESFDRRVPAFRLPDFDAADWHDIVGSVLTTISFPMLMLLSPGAWKAIDPTNPSSDKKWELSNPEGFTKKLFEFSTLGMDDEERRRIRDWQMSQLGNWKNVDLVAERLGQFYYDWSQLVDPDSKIFSVNQGLADVLLEIDNPDDPTPKITSSTMIRHIEDALIIGPDKRPASESTGFSDTWDWNNPLKVADNDPENIETEFGTRLVRIIMDEINRVSAQVGKTHLHAQLMALADAAGLIGDPAPLAQLLNLDPTLVQGSMMQAKSAQSTHAALLRALHKDVGLSESDEDILPLRLVQSALQDITRNPKVAVLSPTVNALYIPNTDLHSVQAELFKRVGTDDVARGETLSAALNRHPAQSLVDYRTLLAGLAVPVVGNAALTSLWNQGITYGAFMPDEATAIAQGQSKVSQLAVTSILCRKGIDVQASYARFHVLRNMRDKRTLIVGEDRIANDLYNRLKRNGVIYFSQNHPDTEQRLTTELNLIKIPDLKQAAKAFLMRNELLTGASYASMLACLAKPGETRLVKPVFVSEKAPEDLLNKASKPALNTLDRSRLFSQLVK